MQATCSGLDLETVPTSSILSACKHWVCKNQSTVLLTHTQYYTIVKASKGFGLLVISSLFILSSLLISDTLLTE